MPNNMSDVIDIWDNPRLTKLNLACLQDVRPVAKSRVNVDIVASSNVLQMNIFELPWSFERDTFDYVLAKHVLEHVPRHVAQYGYEHNFLQLFMEKIWRVLKVGAYWTLRFQVVFRPSRKPWTTRESLLLNHCMCSTAATNGLTIHRFVSNWLA